MKIQRLVLPACLLAILLAGGCAGDSSSKKKDKNAVPQDQPVDVLTPESE